MPQQATKICARCHQEKPLTGYYSTARKKGSVRYDSYCRECRIEYNRAQYLRKHRENIEARKVIRANTPDGHKYCPRCKRIQPLDMFFFIPSTGKPYSYCRECSRELARGHKKASKERQGVFRHKDGRFYEHKGIYRSYTLYWSGNMLSVLRKYYPNTPNTEIAEMLGVSEATVYRKAHSIGLHKNEQYIRECRIRSGLQAGIVNRCRFQNLKNRQQQ